MSFRISRRSLLQFGGLGAASWLWPVSRLLAEQPIHRRTRPKSVILLWLDGGPSQLETLDPHAGTWIAAGTGDISTSLPGVRLAQGMERTAEALQHCSLVRNIVSREGDHERAAYHVKTGYRPDPTIDHPSLGAIVCHETNQADCELPGHVSLLPGARYGRGGFLGPEFDAYRIYHTDRTPPDLTPVVSPERYSARLTDLEILEQTFRDGRRDDLDSSRTHHRSVTKAALAMMHSVQLEAFDVSRESSRARDTMGNTEFGNACLAAVRLVQAGVRCVEVTLGGWDTHVDNHESHQQLVRILDPALGGTIELLRDRKLFGDCLVICGGEFGRTPVVNPVGGRDHWPHGFSMLLAGGGIVPGTIVGQTDPDGARVNWEQGTPVADVMATVLAALGINGRRELITPVGRPMKLCDGNPIAKLIG